MARDRLLKAAAVLAALSLWQAAALLLDQRILLVGPLDVIKELVRQAARLGFWITIWRSLWRIVLGFMLALFAGALLAASSYRFKAIKAMVWPYISAIKATPVASVIILILLFASSRNLSVIVSALIVLPVAYSNILEGLSDTDAKLLEMADLFHAGLRKRFFCIYLPQLRPYLASTCAASIGMAWKAGTAAEVIGIPKGSIGERLYEAKIYLSSSELFAWTAVIVALSLAIEKLALWLIGRSYLSLWRS